MVSASALAPGLVVWLPPVAVPLYWWHFHGKDLSDEALDVYRKAIEFLGAMHRVIRVLPPQATQML